MFHIKLNHIQGRIQDFKLGGAHLKKLRRVEEGAKILGVFRAKNHYSTPKNHIFYNCGGWREHFWGISCEKSRFYAKKSYFFPILEGAYFPFMSIKKVIPYFCVLREGYYVIIWPIVRICVFIKD
jgi:hypothetical protein